MHDNGTSLRTDGRDPLGAMESADAHGMIGRVAWAAFKRGDGLVINFDVDGRKFSVPVDSSSEKGGFLRFVTALLRLAPRLTP